MHTVLEATSKSRTRAELARHLDAGARRVISLAPPARRPPDLLAVPGLTDGLASTPEHRIVSNASSTVHAVAPILEILHDAFGIERAIFTTVHSYTSQHHLADVPAEDKRRGRAAAENIIPQESRSPGMLAEVLPELAGTDHRLRDERAGPERLGRRSRVLAREAGLAGGRQRGRADGRRDRPLEPNPPVRRRSDRLVGRRALDLIRRSSTRSRRMTLADRVSKTLSWYDSGYGYAHRAVDLLERFAALEAGARAGMTIRVGINGFGRIGRSVFRILSDRPDVEVVAINDLYDNDQLAYLLKYDTVMRVFAEEGLDRRGLDDGGRPAYPHDGGDATRAGSAGATLGADIVVEATGVLRTRAKLEGHLAAGRQAGHPDGPAEGRDRRDGRHRRQRRHPPSPSTASSPTPPARPTAWRRSRRSSTSRSASRKAS